MSLFNRLLANKSVSGQKSLASAAGLDPFQRWSSFLKPSDTSSLSKVQARRATHDLRYDPRSFFGSTLNPGTGYTQKNAYTPSGRADVRSQSYSGSMAHQSKINQDFNRFSQMRNYAAETARQKALDPRAYAQEAALKQAQNNAAPLRRAAFDEVTGIVEPSIKKAG